MQTAPVLGIAFAASAAVLLAAGVAAAQADDVVNACYLQKGGDLRRVERPSNCGKGETSLVWSITGPEGLTGPAGPAGPAGPKGDPGPAGGFGAIQVVETCGGTCTSQFYDEYLQVFALCPSGTRLISGGYKVVPGRFHNGQTQPVLEVRENAPTVNFDNPTLGGWVATIKVPPLTFQDLKVTAFCVEG